MPLLLHNFFHLNLAYSAIEEEDRPEVIEKCYWPLLRLARKQNLPLSIELSGYTLEVIQTLDPLWVEELAALIEGGSCELIGCGYAQVIGPLVPHDITTANLRIGHAVYESVLGVRPTIALLNEQAYSSGLVPLYKEAGYDAIIMEWNNPAHERPEWDAEWRYLPQRAKGTCESEISLIWNESTAFQKFQRYAHGELELAELLAYVRSHQGSCARALPLYGNDVEVFDYRPGRYKTEARVHDDGEWTRICHLYQVLQQEPDIKFIKTSEVLDMGDIDGAYQLLRLDSARQPIPVKKQDKYNVTRWAVTGRDDLNINTQCWNLYKSLEASVAGTESDWKELCYLWSSDFRTHITESRWSRYLARLRDFQARFSSGQPASGSTAIVHAKRFSIRPQNPPTRSGRFVEFHGNSVSIRLNSRKGLAIESFIDRTVSPRALFGTVHHGYFDDIQWNADFYSGHLVFESPGQPKITDLVPVEPNLQETDYGAEISCEIITPLGLIRKNWQIDDKNRTVTLTYHLEWGEAAQGSLRLGHVTLIPGALNRHQLRYETHNGGREPEVFNIQSSLGHGQPVSHLTSARQAVSLTGEEIVLADDSCKIKVGIQKTQKALVGMVSHNTVGETHLTRVYLSALECDDTSKPVVIAPFHVDICYCARLK